MNPTINMWTNRLKRIASAWDDPSNERVRSSRPLIKSKFAWRSLYASEIVILGIAFYRLQTVSIIYSFSEFFAVLLSLLLAHVVFYKLCARSNVRNGFDFDLSNIIASAIFSSLIGMAIWVFINASYLDRPVTQEVYNVAIEQYPSCKRFDDYRIFKTDRNEVFMNRDIHTSIGECKETQNINSLLEKQRKITNSQKSIK